MDKGKYNYIVGVWIVAKHNKIRDWVAIGYWDDEEGSWRVDATFRFRNPFSGEYTTENRGLLLEKEGATEEDFIKMCRDMAKVTLETDLSFAGIKEQSFAGIKEQFGEYTKEILIQSDDKDVVEKAIIDKFANDNFHHIVILMPPETWAN